MDEEKKATKEEMLQREIESYRMGNERLSGTINVLESELRFWKRYAMEKEGMDSEKINRLLQEHTIRNINSGGLQGMGAQLKRF